ncbi:MAG: Crp/Fnr family transcriptional regulator [Evtepia sp.]|uniref:Crp/Fnr family transcriptional regulator n=1 Tax=Evtepia sp. TaxID=2773933 RepID=UPI002A7612CD|nr:Crp/Fnr family transcriptional regulator [Evtepia sp.]MDY3013922.1 Crp/Fnr family transcriptional regulator [Evtepia sp.]
METAMHSPLFRGLEPEEIRTVLGCLAAWRRTYPKGAVIFSAGEPIRAMGLVERGSVFLESDDLWGNKTVLGRAGPGQVFGESYACAPGEPLLVNAVAAQETSVLFLEVGRLLTVCSQACGHHTALIRNLLEISAQKNLGLSRKIFYTRAKTIRGRLLAYLSDQALLQGSHSFAIPCHPL